jgi:hypothetical protein
MLFGIVGSEMIVGALVNTTVVSVSDFGIEVKLRIWELGISVAVSITDWIDEGAAEINTGLSILFKFKCLAEMRV